MVVAGRQQYREVDLIAFADGKASAVTLVVVGDVVEDGCCRARIRKRCEVEDEFVGARTSSQSVRTKTAVDDSIAEAATQDICAGPARDSVRQIVTVAGEVG